MSKYIWMIAIFLMRVFAVPVQRFSQGTPLIDDTNECASNKTNIWLDISILLESSNIMTPNSMSEISGTLASVFYGMTISQTLPQSSHVAVNTFAPSDITTDLSTYSNGADLSSRFLSLSTLNLTPTNTLTAMQEAIALFNGPGRRTNVRQVLFLVLASFSAGSQDDITRLSVQFKDSYGVLIVINYVPNGGAAVPGICALSSPGMCFIVQGNQEDDPVQGIVTALCTGE